MLIALNKMMLTRFLFMVVLFAGCSNKNKDESYVIFSDKQITVSASSGETSVMVQWAYTEWEIVMDTDKGIISNISQTTGGNINDKTEYARIKFGYNANTTEVERSQELFVVNKTNGERSSLVIEQAKGVKPKENDPCLHVAKLTDATRLQMTGNSGTGSLSGTPYHYEIWIDAGGAQGAELYWYGANQGGGAAFRAEWTNPNTYLGRIGYFWGNGQKYTAYKNIYCDFNYTRSNNGTAGSHSYIGIYGWGRNPGAAEQSRRLVEYYIVDDWFNEKQLGSNTICYPSGCQSLGYYSVDEGTYDVYTNIRVDQPSIDGTKTFVQYFSIRRDMEGNRRQCGTISVSEHFKKWEALGLELGNMYEVKFLVEAGSGTGWLDLSYLSFSQEDNPRQ